MTETPAPDLRALRELAEAATPGLRFSSCCVEVGTTRCVCEPTIVVRAAEVLALIERVEAAEAAVKRVDKVRRWVVPNGYAGGPEGDKTTAVMVRLDDLRAALDADS